MGMNIKNPEAERLARQVAALTGETMTAAVLSALRARLDQLEHAATKQERLKRAREIAADCASRIPERVKSIDHGKLLYDDVLGLPK